MMSITNLSRDLFLGVSYNSICTTTTGKSAVHLQCAQHFHLPFLSTALIYRLTTKYGGVDMFFPQAVEIVDKFL